MNNLTTQQKSLPASVSALTQIGQNAVATTGTIGTGDAFGGFEKDGFWRFGQEKIETEEGSIWAINPLSLRHGHIGWPVEGGGRPTELTVPLTDPMPESPARADDGLDWGNCMSWQARCTNGEDEGQQVLFKGGSHGFLKCTAGIAQQISQRAIAGETDVVPLVELESSSYQHKKFGKINTPELKVVGWQSLDGTSDDAEPEAEAEAPAAEPEAAPEPAKPARRRRVRK